jgi:hypothetical protein
MCPAHIMQADIHEEKGVFWQAALQYAYHLLGFERFCIGVTCRKGFQVVAWNG